MKEKFLDLSLENGEIKRNASETHINVCYSIIAEQKRRTMSVEK